MIEDAKTPLDYLTTTQLLEELKRRSNAIVVGFDPIATQGLYTVFQSGDSLVNAGLIRDLSLDNVVILKKLSKTESDTPLEDDPDYQPPALNPKLKKFDDTDLLDELKARSLAFVFGFVSKSKASKFRVHRFGWKLLIAGLIRTLQLDSDDEMQRTLGEPPSEGN